MGFYYGDRVRVVDTDIIGSVDEIRGARIVITDDHAETDDVYLQFHVSDLELYEED